MAAVCLRTEPYLFCFDGALHALVRICAAQHVRVSPQNPTARKIVSGPARATNVSNLKI